MTYNVFNEKYRPKTLDEVVGQETVVSLLKQYVKTRKVPHMMFVGPPGTGKTSCAYAFARDLYGSRWRDYFYEMNASDERKLKDVREKIKPYAQVKVLDEDFRIIFLDEVDHMSYDAQPALRRIIENYSDKCRFILSCNYPHKVIEPIKDRCVMFRFKPVNISSMITMLRRVSNNEGIDISDDGLERLCELSKGSMRRSLSILEKLHSANVTNITSEVIENYFCYIKEDDIVSMIDLLKKGDIQSISKYVDELLYDKAYTPIEILTATERLLRESNLQGLDFATTYAKLGDTDFRISVGATPDIQLKSFFVYILKLFEGVKNG